MLSLRQVDDNLKEFMDINGTDRLSKTNDIDAFKEHNKWLCSQLEMLRGNKKTIDMMLLDLYFSIKEVAILNFPFDNEVGILEDVKVYLEDEKLLCEDNINN